MRIIFHIKRTPRETKSMAQTLYKGTGLGSEGPKPHFCQFDFLALKGARGQAYGGDDTEMIYIQNPCRSSSLGRGEELGHGCFRQLKSKGAEEEGEEGRKDCWPTEFPR